MGRKKLPENDIFGVLLKRIKGWYRYQHFTTHPAKENHSHVIMCIGYLEHLSGVSLPCDKGEKESWKDFLKAFKSLTYEKLKQLEVKINTKYK